MYNYLEWFKDLLIQYPHHDIEKIRFVQILYEGMDYPTKTIVESCCNGGFTQKTANQAWTYLEEVAENTTHGKAPHLSGKGARTSWKGAQERRGDILGLQSPDNQIKNVIIRASKPRQPDKNCRSLITWARSHSQAKRPLRASLIEMPNLFWRLMRQISNLISLLEVNPPHMSNLKFYFYFYFTSFIY